MASFFRELGTFYAMCSLLVGLLGFGTGTGDAMFQNLLAALEFVHSCIIGPWAFSGVS